MFSYTINTKTDFGARTGVIKTQHGEIKTPAFIPVGTAGAMKGPTPEQMENVGAQALLANAYHLFLRPGPDVVEQAGGLNKFMNWNHPTFTDSGGFQILSFGSGFKKVLDMNRDEIDEDDENLPEPKLTSVSQDKISDKPLDISDEPLSNSNREKLARVNDDGVEFTSFLDGKKYFWTPKTSMDVQFKIGADIIFAFDELTSLHDSYEYQKQSIERTFRWAKICASYHQELCQSNHKEQALFGVVQGADFEDLRKLSASQIGSIDYFSGFGYGGALEKSKIPQIIQWINSQVPEAKPRHLLGISEVDDLFNAVENGIDTFDCVSPSRVGRNGAVYTTKGRFNIGREPYKFDFGPIDETCECYVCQNYTRAYLCHLTRSKEILGGLLNTLHNEYFIIHLIDQMREAIDNGDFKNFKESFLKSYYSS